MKKITIIFVVIWAFVFSASAQHVEFVKTNFPGKKDGFKEARKNFKQGNKYFEIGKGMYLTALDFYTPAYNFNPNHALLNFRMGVCYLKTINKPKSISFFEKALELDRNVDPEIKYLLAQAYHFNGDLDKAVKMYEEYKSSLAPQDLNLLRREIDKKIEECHTAEKLIKTPVRVFIDNLGSTVNSSFPEYSPLINADETVLFFTSRRDVTIGGKKDENDLQYFEDIFSSHFINKQWTSPVNHKKPLNGKMHDATVGLSPDGQTLLIYKGVNGGDIYECRLKGDEWTKPEKLGKNINTKFQESSASFAPDGRTLYFVSDREGGFGQKDIYMSQKNKRGEWGPAVNLGQVINTEYDEEGVFMHPNGKTLYFSSQGHKTMGGFDIFKSTYENGVWSTPENMGYPINSTDDDVFFSISASGLHGYYSSVKPEGLGGQDLYMITFLGAEKPVINNNEDNLIAIHTQPVSETAIEPPVEIKENQVTILKGIVMDDFTSAPLGASIELADLDKNEVIATFESNSKTGKYLISLPSGKNYGITVRAQGYLFHSENFNIPPTTTFREVERDIRLKKLDVGSVIVLNNIFFDFNKSTLRPESTAELDRLVKLMNEFPALKIEISGHTDNIGTAQYNKKLSESRAKSVVDYLISKGINADRLTYVGYGFDKPVATNDTEEGRQLNRRTEFKIISK